MLKIAVQTHRAKAIIVAHTRGRAAIIAARHAIVIVVGVGGGVVAHANTAIAVANCDVRGQSRHGYVDGRRTPCLCTREEFSNTNERIYFQFKPFYYQYC